MQCETGNWNDNIVGNNLTKNASRNEMPNLQFTNLKGSKGLLYLLSPCDT